MRKSSTLSSLIVLLAIAFQSAAQDSDQQVRVITSGGFHSGPLTSSAPYSSRPPGSRWSPSTVSSMGGGPESIPVRLGRGETFDLLIFNGSAFEGIAATDRIRPASRIELARSIVGMAVRSGSPKPNISTMEAFVETLLAAESIGYSASVSGTYLSTVVWPELGIWDEIEDKTTRVVGERVASVVARGDVEIGFQARSEILPIEGADYAGPIPDDIQRVATIVVVMTDHMENPEHAHRLVDFLSSEEAAAVIDSTGLVPVALEEPERVKVITSGGFTAAFSILGPIFQEGHWYRGNHRVRFPPWAAGQNPSRFAWSVVKRRTFSFSTGPRSMS